MGGWGVRRVTWLLSVRFLVVEQGVGIKLLFFFVLFFSCFQLFFYNWELWLLCLFLCFLFAFFISSAFNKMLLVHRNSCVFSVKLFQKPGSEHFSVDFLEKWRKI